MTSFKVINICTLTTIVFIANIDPHTGKEPSTMANTISFAIPEPIVAYIDNRVVTGGYGNRSEYIRDLVRNDQREQAKVRLRELVAEGLASGPATAMTSADWADMESVARGEVRV